MQEGSKGIIKAMFGGFFGKLCIGDNVVTNEDVNKTSVYEILQTILTNR
jgi:hypothetical protein